MSAIQLGPSNAANRFEAKERLEKRTKAKGLSGDSWGVFANVGLAEEATKTTPAMATTTTTTTKTKQQQQQEQQQKKNNRRLTKVTAQGSHVQDR